MAEPDNYMISVVVPNYNNGAYLLPCLKSILNQSYQDLEIIVVDDCSTDKSISIIQSLCRKDNRLKIIRNETNQGVALSRDIGIRASKGRWLTTLDSDDLLLRQDKLEKEIALAEIKSFDGLEPIVFSNIMLINADGKILGAQPGLIKEGDILSYLLSRSCMVPRDFIFTKKQYENVGGFDKNFPIYEDWDLKLRLAARYNFFYSGIDGIGYRRHDNGLSSASLAKHIRFLHKVFTKNRRLINTNKWRTTYMFHFFLLNMIFKRVGIKRAQVFKKL